MSLDITFQFYSAAEAADEIGVTHGRIRQLLNDGAMLGHKCGTQWAIPRAEVERVKKIERKTGRPRVSERKM